MIKLSENSFSFFTLEKRKNSEIFAEAVSYPDLHICFVTKGDAVWEIGGTARCVSYGSIVFLSDSQKRRFLEFGKNGLTLSVISLDRRAFTDSYHFSFFLNCVQKSNGFLCAPTLVPILKELYSELQGSGENRYQLASCKLTEFFIKAERLLGYSATQSRRYDSKMIDILDYIDSKISERISLSDAARLTGFTESSFSRWFARVNGVSFKKYVMAKKIDRAMLLLETTDMKVVDVAYECGFDSISGFYDAFKKITGTTPNKFSFRHSI